MLDLIDRIICGECLSVAARIPDGSMDLVVTDPPYEIEDMSPYFMEIRRVLKASGTMYCFGDKNMIAEHWFRQAVGFFQKELLIWHYRNSPKPKGRWRLSMQGIIYATKGRGAVFNEDEVRVEYTEAAKRLHGRIRPSAGRLGKAAPYDTSKGALPRDVIDCPALLGHLARERVGHPDQKPLALIEKLVKASSAKGDVVLDMFAGSGTTLVAAKHLGRRYVGIELCQQHVEVIELRLKKEGLYNG